MCFSIQLADLVKLPREIVWQAFSHKMVPSVMTWQGESKSALDSFFRDVASTYRCQEVHKVMDGVILPALSHDLAFF